MKEGLMMKEVNSSNFFKENIIVHIPHASLNIPDFCYNKTILQKDELEKENIFISDYLVDKFAPNNCKNVIKFNYSRLFCDVERFKDDKLEVMSKYGMGVVYEKDHKGNKFINLDQEYKRKVINEYYDKHHLLLDIKTEEILKKYKNCYIIDLHSFSDEFVKKLLNKDKNPDICIGYNCKFCDYKLLLKTIKHFGSYGYIVNENYPYSGSLIPNKYYKSEKFNICSIMLEINKRIYLDNNTTINEDKYKKLKKCMEKYYKLLNNYVR